MNIFEALECVRAGHQMRHADWPAGTSLQLRYGYPALVEENDRCSGVTPLSHLHERLHPELLKSTHWETVAVNGISAREVTFSATAQSLDEAPAGYDLSMTSRVMHIEAELADAENHPELLELIGRLYRKHEASIAINDLTCALERGQRVTGQVVYGPGGRQRAARIVPGAQLQDLHLEPAGTPYVIGAYFDDTSVDSGRRQLDGIRHIIDGLGYKAPEQHESERLRIAAAIEQLQKTFKL